MKKITSIGLIIFLLLILSVTPSFGSKHAIKKSEYKEQEILVKFKKGISKVRKAKAHVELNAKKLSESGNIGVERVKLPPDISVEEAIGIYREMPDIEYAEPNYLKQLLAVPNDVRYSDLWGLEKVSMPAAWNLTQGSNNVIVAVLDTGVAYDHPDLKDNMWKNTGEIPDNGIDEDNNGRVDDYRGFNFGSNRYPETNPMDIDDHGTHVAGTIGAKGNNSIGVSGVNWNVKIMPVNVFSGGSAPFSATTYDIVEGLNYVISMKNKGHKIVAVNSSYGGGSSSDSELNAIKALRNAGILLIAAAGNAGTNNDTTPAYPANYDSDNVISVAATSSSDNLADFSNYGNSVDLAAPGNAILSTIPAGEETFLTGSSATYAATAMTYSGLTDTEGITASVINCGKGLAPSDFPSGVSGNLALIERGTITFKDKVINAQNAGAAGVIIYNNEPGNFFGTLGEIRDWVPVVSISQADGQAIAAQGSTTMNLVNRQLFDYMSFDGTSMATPHVTGVAALLASYKPNLSYIDIKNRILAGVDKLPALNGKVATGGRLNAFKIFDFTAPNLSVTAPESAKHIKGILSLSGSAADPAIYEPSLGLKDIKIYRGTSLLTTATSSSFIYKTDTIGLNNGKHTYKIIATDNAGNSKQWSRYYYIDNTKPVALAAYMLPVSPKKGTYAKLFYKATDNNVARKVYFTLQIRKASGALVSSRSVGWRDNGILYSTSLRMPGISGSYIYRLKINDYAGNSTTKNRNFIVQ